MVIKRILLVNPFQVTSKGYDFEVVKGGGQYAEPPLGLGYLASSLKGSLSRDMEVEIYDANMEAIKAICEGAVKDASEVENLLKSKIERYKPDLVGVSCLFHSNYKSAHQVCRVTKTFFPECVTVMGGVYPTVSTKEALNGGNVDFAVLSEGERTLVNLVRALSGDILLQEVDGIAFKLKSHFILQYKKEFIGDLDTLPWPSRDDLYLPDYTEYSRHFLAKFGDKRDMVMANLSASRGCPFMCTFCSTRLHWGSRIRYRKPSEVVDEMEHLKEKYGVTHFIFNDDNLTCNNKIVQNLFDEVIRRKLHIKWTSAGGFGVMSLSDVLIDSMIESGLVSFSLGIESGSRKTLARVKKPLKLEKVVPVVERIRKYSNSYITGLFMIGFPWETEKDIKDSLDFASSLDLDWALFLSPQPYPGTQFYKECLDGGYLPQDFRYEDLTLHHAHFNTPNFDSKDLEGRLYWANLVKNFDESRNLTASPDRLEQACRDFRWVTEMVPDHAVAYYYLGEAMTMLGNPTEGKKYYEKALSIASRDEFWGNYFKRLGILNG